MIHEHPLAYLLGLEGLSLLRAFAGEHDRDFVAARIAEVRLLLDDETLTRTSTVDVVEVGTVDGYRQWSRTYDEPGNPVFDLDAPLIDQVLDTLDGGGVALDAACGTGRHAHTLARRGFRVIGVDSSPEMLDRARARVPGGEFRLGDLRRLPVPDGSVDVVVCALALTHIADLRPVIAEFARVLRPGGHVLIADMHPETVLRAWSPRTNGPDGQPGRVDTYRHLTGDYLRAALAVGLRPLRCEEPVEQLSARPPADPPATTDVLEPWEHWPWTLGTLIPEATRAAHTGIPTLIFWQFRLDPS